MQKTGEISKSTIFQNGEKKVSTKAFPKTAYVRANERKARLHRNIIH